MLSATQPPRCSVRLANSRRYHLAHAKLARAKSALALVAILLSLAPGMMSLATASPSASVEESPKRFVGPPSRLQPRLSNETGTPRGIALAAPTKPTARANPVAQVQALTPLIPTPASDTETIPQPPLINDPQLNEEIFAGDAIAEGGETVDPLPCYVSRPLSSLSISIVLPAGELPENVAIACAANMGTVNDIRLEYGWAQFDFHWAASCLCHAPLYFEETNAERYGYTPSYFFQPLISAGRFFLTIPALPYKMVVDRSHDCIYTLGLYRPGSCVPRRWNHLPLDIAAATVEVGVIAGLILLIP